MAKHGLVIKDHTVTGLLARPTLRLMDVVGNAPHGVALTYNYLTAGGVAAGVSGHRPGAPRSA